MKCHQTGDQAVVTWSPHAKAKERYRELNGKVLDNKGEVQFILHGAWDKGMTRRRPGRWLCGVCFFRIGYIILYSVLL